MAIKVLLIDPSSDWLISAQDLLRKNFFDVKTANNGKDAQIIISKDKFFAVAINLEVQNYSSHQVLKFIKSNQNVQKIIAFITSEEKLIEMGLDHEQVLKMGATEVVTSIPSPAELKNILEGHQGIQDFVTNLNKRDGQSEEVEVSTTDDKFSAIGIDEFYSSKNVLFDIYIKLGTNRYLKILHTGDTFSRERIDKYKNEKKVTHLYISTDDRKKFIHWNNFVAEKTIANSNVDAQRKIDLLTTVSEKYIEEIYSEGLKPQMVEQGKALCNSTFQLLEKEKGLFKLIRQYQDLDPTAFSHFFLISLFSSMIVKQFEWQSKSTIETVTMASMLHDLGKIKLPKVLLHLNPKDMTPDQFVIYKQHPQMSAELLENNRLISPSVKQIILQHHEASDGTGFPFGLKENNTLTLSKILFFVNEFVDRITHAKQTPVEGLRDLLMNKEECSRYNSVVLENFTKVFIDPSKLKKNDSMPSNSTVVPSRKSG